MSFFAETYSSFTDLPAMFHRFHSLALACAIVLGMTNTSTHAAPAQWSRPEILKADLSEWLKPADLTMLVFMPTSCEGRDLAAVCRQFRQFAPSSESALYRAVDDIAKRRSIVGQVQALPAALRERRYVMLLDWKYRFLSGQVRSLFSLNGEVVVYDQVEKKVVWHAVALYETDAASEALARNFINRAVLGVMTSYVTEHRLAAKLGIEIRDLSAAAEPGKDYNVVIFNRRQDGAKLVESASASVAIRPIAPDSPHALQLIMPADTHVALKMPHGKFRIESMKQKVEPDAGSHVLAYRLGTGGFLGPDFTIEEVRPDAFEQERRATRNVLVPDVSEASQRRLGELSWADVPAEPGAPVSGELPAR